MRKFYTAEAVTEGHPDKLCDQIADAILDVCLKQDEQSRVACEVLATKGTIIVAGEITSTYEPDVFAVVRKVLSDVGYSSEGIAMDTFVHRQSPDIAGAVDTSKERREGVSDNQIDWFQWVIPVKGLQWTLLSIDRVPILQGQSILQKNEGKECLTIR